MSTFNGIVKEFPGIQFDYFRRVNGEQASLANFLSHIHSDHLTGLAGKSYRAPFIYCSAATKQLLLKLQRRLHRFNYAKKLVESHEYAYLDYAKRDRMLREIPLETPTEIELCPGYTIRVTLFDANHCPGSTMFLIEGQGKAILYTGDIRAEPWWLEKLKRNPILLPYFTRIKTLDCLYLDTTHASFEASHLTFSSKADGIRDLLTQVSKYPPETVFHLNTWTLGYEDAWVALASYFRSQIHLDDYRLRLFNAIGSKEAWEHGAFLLGNSLGDTVLTDDKNVRFHSCERWLPCEGRDKARLEGKLVEISPLVAKYRDSNGTEYMLREPGEGGGNVDANLVDEVSGELLLELSATVKDHRLSQLIQQASVKAGFILPLDAATPGSDIKLNEFIEIIKRNLENLIAARQQEPLKTESQPRSKISPTLPTWFGYPASRHSSFSELQSFVKALAPKDVYPCVAADGSWYQKDSIRKLFGKYCTGREFAFDIERALDIDFVAETREDLEYLELQEKRAAGMDEESQQARSQNLLLSSQGDLSQVRGPTQSDDSEIRRQVDETVRRIKFVDHSNATCLPGDTQADEYDPKDPDIIAKVERAIEDGRLMSKSILNINSSDHTIQVHRTPDTSETRILPGVQKPATRPTQGETESDSEIILVASKEEYKRVVTPSKRSYNDLSHSSSAEKQNARRMRYNDTGATNSEISSEAPIEWVSETFEEMNCSQDSLPSSIGDLDREGIKDAMRAVQEGRWLEKSRRLGFNNMNWKYEEDKEI